MRPGPRAGCQSGVKDSAANLVDIHGFKNKIFNTEGTGEHRVRQELMKFL